MGEAADAANLSYVGLAISGASCAWINVGLLYWVLHRRGQFTVDAQLKRRAIRLLLATLAMAALLLFLDPLTAAHASGTIAQRIGALLLLIVPAGACYFGCAFLFGAFDWRETKALLRRRRG